MMTTEPTVELKLKKGGHVSGHSAMKSTMPMEMADNRFAAPGKAPKKPSIMERRKSMKAPMLMSKKGGVAKKADGGMMGAPMGAPAAPGGMMTPAMKRALMMRMMAQRGAMRPGMMPPAAPMAAPMGPAMKKGGKAGDMGQDKAMIKKAFMQHDMQEHMGGKGTKLKLKNGGSSIPSETSSGDYAKTKVYQAKKDSASGTGAIKMGKPAGYATGGSIPSETSSGSYKTTKVYQAKPDNASGTGGVKMSNAGGFAGGGEVNWENRPANSAKPGKTNTKTGEVKEANAGGYKKGGAAKKHFATGGSVNNAGHAVAMPRKPVSKPVANTMQSGTFAKGGKVVSDWTVLNPSLKQKFNRVNAPAEKEEKPNLRLLKTHTGPKGHVAKVYKDKDWGEHRVKFFSPEGKHYSQADYHTDDAEDAHDTAQGQLNRYKSGGKMVRKAEGGSMPTADDGYDPMIAREARRREVEQETNRRENESTPVMDSVKRLLGMGPKAGAGRGFVNPPMARKTGGRAC